MNKNYEQITPLLFLESLENFFININELDIIIHGIFYLKENLILKKIMKKNFYHLRKANIYMYIYPKFHDPKFHVIVI